MTLTAIDQIIGREVGQLCWDLLPEVHPGLEYDDQDEKFREVWRSEEADELLAVREADPPVNYPVLYLNVDLIAGLAASPFLFPAKFGRSLRLSEYLGCLRRFLILQLTTTEQAHVPLIWRAVRSLAPECATDELLLFVDQLWRGRWIVGDSDWSHMRLSVITGGGEEAVRRLDDDEERLEAEALRLIQAERHLKDAACSMDEWFFEAYCLLPDIATWLFAIRRRLKRQHSDELEKYDRVLDEYLADIHTTLSIPCTALRTGEGLVETYALKPLREAATVDAALATIRGTYRGRTIIPKVWYELTRVALERIKADTKEGSAVDEHNLREREYDELNRLDRAQAFGYPFTASERDLHWLVLLTLFDYSGPEDPQQQTNPE